MWALEYEDDDGRWIELDVFPGRQDLMLAYRRFKRANPLRGLRVVRKEHYLVQEED